MDSVMQQMEQTRLKLKTRMVVSSSISAVIGLLSGVGIFLSTGDEEWYVRLFSALLAAVVIGFLLLCVLLAIVYNKKYAALNDWYKSNIVTAALNEVLEQLVYEPKKGLAQSVVAETGMIPNGTFYETDDYLAGLYHGTLFYQADVSVKGRTGRNVTTYFNGKWMLFDSSRDSSHTGDFYLHIREKEFLGATKSFAVNYPQIKTENEAFNKKFKVYTNNFNQAGRFVSPSFMEKLLALKDSLPKESQLLLCCQNGRLHIALDGCVGSMDASVFRKMDETAIDQAREDILLITSLVDVLAGEAVSA